MSIIFSVFFVRNEQQPAFRFLTHPVLFKGRRLAADSLHVYSLRDTYTG